MSDYSIEEALIRYKGLISNTRVRDISMLVEPNTALATNERAFVEKAIKNIDNFFSKADDMTNSMCKNIKVIE